MNEGKIKCAIAFNILPLTRITLKEPEYDPDYGPRKYDLKISWKLGRTLSVRRIYITRNRHGSVLYDYIIS